MSYSLFAFRRSAGCDRSLADGRSRGLTLLEMLVVLVLLGLAVTLAAPSFLSTGRPPDDAVQRVIDSARRAAVQRAETVTLSIETDGRWVIESVGGPDSLRLFTGTIAWPHGSSVRLDISPLGACMLYSAPEPSLTIDPVRCRLRGRSGSE